MFQLSKKQDKSEILIPIIVGIMSLWNILAQTIWHIGPYINYLSILVSVIGICSTVLYFRRIKFFAVLIYIWAFAQLPYITREVIDEQLQLVVKKPLLDCTQGFKVTYGLYFGSKDNLSVLHVYFNFVGLIYLGLARIIYLSSLFGTKIRLKPFKQDNSLSDILPDTATIEQRITLGDERNWVLIHLDKTESQDDISYALIKPKDGGTLSPTKKKQIVFFLLVADPSMLDEPCNRSDFKAGDWAVVNG